MQAAGTPIGSGPCGPVYKCHLSGLEVAIKILSTLNTSKDEHTAAAAVDFKAHVDMLSRLSHDSLLPLMGCCPERQALVFPYMPGGNLIDRLGPAHPNGRLWWQVSCQPWTLDESQTHITTSCMQQNPTLLDFLEPATPMRYANARMCAVQLHSGRWQLLGVECTTLNYYSTVCVSVLLTGPCADHL